MILAWASRPPGTLPCYTWGGEYRDCADVKIARRTAQLCQQPHKTIIVGADFLSQFPNLAESAVYISDGTMDVTGSIDLYVQRLARQIAPVRVSGVCGGEILRRLVMFKPGPPEQGIFEPELERSIREAATSYAEELQDHRLSFTAFKQAPWYMASKFAVERSQVTYRTPYFDNELVALAYQTPATLLQNAPALRLIADGNPALGKIGTDRGIAWQSIPAVTRVSIGGASSRLRRSMPMIIVCPSGWPGSTMPLHHFTSKSCSLAGTSFITFASGTATNYLNG